MATLSLNALAISDDVEAEAKAHAFRCVSVKPEQTEQMTQLMRRGVSPSARQSGGMFGTWSLLHVAAWHGQAEITELLIGLRADVSAANKKGDTPLRLATHKGQLVVAKLLVQAQADPSTANSSGVSALDSAASGASEASTALVELFGRAKNTNPAADAPLPAPADALPSVSAPAPAPASGSNGRVAGGSGGSGGSIAAAAACPLKERAASRWADYESSDDENSPVLTTRAASATPGVSSSAGRPAAGSASSVCEVEREARRGAGAKVGRGAGRGAGRDTQRGVRGRGSTLDHAGGKGRAGSRDPPVASDHAMSDRVSPDRVSSDRVSSDRAARFSLPTASGASNNDPVTGHATVTTLGGLREGTCEHMCAVRNPTYGSAPAAISSPRDVSPRRQQPSPGRHARASFFWRSASVAAVMATLLWGPLLEFGLIWQVLHPRGEGARGVPGALAARGASRHRGQ